MSLYNLFNAISGYVLILFNVLHFRKKSQNLSVVSNSAIRYISTREKQGIIIHKVLASPILWAIVEAVLISFVQYNYVGFLNAGASKLFNTGANYFGVLYGAPILVVLLCLLVKIDPLAQMDLITPAYPLALFFVKIACYFGGCCRGFEWEKGFYNPVSRLIEFPSQLLESGVALILFIILFVLRNRFKRGTVFPIYLISYSTLRFFTEFTRVEPEVFMGLKTYHFLCIAGVVLGIIEYIFVCLYSKKQSCASAMIEE